MFLKVNTNFDFIKLEQKKNLTSGKTHNYVTLIDGERNPHKFYVPPAIADKVKQYEYLTPVEVDLVVIYGTKDKIYDGLQLKDICVKTTN